MTIPKNNPTSLSLPVYRKISLTFMGLSLVMTLAILYLVSARVTIIITPRLQKINSEFKIKIYSPQVKETIGDDTLKDLNNNCTNCIIGEIFENTVEEREDFPATQVEFEEKKAHGEVIIINNYNRPQTLIRTTRLLSPQGILFRTDHTIRAPTGSKVKVKVYADQPGASGEIEPTRFTIPALWPGLQDKIYGISEKTMSGGLIEIRTITQDDIEQAKKILSEKLFEKALGELREIAKTQDDFQLITQEIAEIEINAKAGDKKNEFEIKMELKLIAIKFEEVEMLNLTQERLKDLLPQKMTLLPLKKENIKYDLKEYDPKTKTVWFKISAEGLTALALESPLLTKDNLIGKTKEEVRAYLEKFPEIESVEVKFSPLWIQKVPVLKDRIKIKISNF